MPYSLWPGVYIINCIIILLLLHENNLKMCTLGGAASIHNNIMYMNNCLLTIIVCKRGNKQDIDV